MSIAMAQKLVKLMERINELEERIAKLEAEKKPVKRRRRKTEDVK